MLLFGGPVAQPSSSRSAQVDSLSRLPLFLPVGSWSHTWAVTFPQGLGCWMSCMSPLRHCCPAVMTPMFVIGTSVQVPGECAGQGGHFSPESAQGTETPCQQGHIKIRFPILRQSALVTGLGD